MPPQKLSEALEHIKLSHKIRNITYACDNYKIWCRSRNKIEQESYDSHLHYSIWPIGRDDTDPEIQALR